MAAKTVFSFEEISDDLPRPPIAALRLLWSSGVSLSIKTWQELPINIRKAIAAEGARDVIRDERKVGFIEGIPVKEVKFVGRTDPNGSPAIPEPVLKQHGIGRPITLDEWNTLRPLERFALTILAKNSRLLWRAYQELIISKYHVPLAPGAGWTGEVARSELRLRAPYEVRADLMRLLAEERLLEGRAFLLARAAGLRSVRRASDVFDLLHDTPLGSVELDWLVKREEGCVLWQAHASTWEGAFSPTASILSVTMATVCLFDMIKEFDPEAYIAETKISNEPWVVGKADWEESTKVLSPANLKRQPSS